MMNMDSTKKMYILGIETSCDETSVAIVSNKREILVNKIWSQLQEHEHYGGVVPEISARAHLQRLDGLIHQAFSETGLTIQDMSGIAATAGPGLIGGVIVGTMTAKGLASASSKPFLAVNHLAGHALTARLTNGIEFPYLLLLVSGGHCQLLIATSHKDFQLLGTTIDDAVGEAFDKTAKLLGFPYPGGPTIETRAATGNPLRFPLPHPMVNHKDTCNMSFSGLKTAVRRLIESESPLEKQTISDICASFQHTVGSILKNRTQQAMRLIREQNLDISQLVMAGGVAANSHIRHVMEELSRQNDYTFIVPPVKLCTDNAAMIAWAGMEMLQSNEQSSLDFAPRPRWPLMELGA